MKNLIIIGVSALGREISSWAEQYNPVLKIKGFLDDRKNVLDGYSGYPTIIDKPETYQIQKNDVFICAVGEPLKRQKYVSIIEKKGGEFVSLIHPTAIVGKNTFIDKGCLIRPQAIIGTDVRIGKNCIIGSNSNVSHDSILEDFITISPGCDIAGWCHIHSNTFLGIHSAIIPHVELGEKGAVYVAAGAVVTRSFTIGRLMGIPAKIK